MTNREIAEERFTEIIRDYVRNNRSSEDLMDLVESSALYIGVLKAEEDLKDYPNLQNTLEGLIQKNLKSTLDVQRNFLLGIRKDLEFLSTISSDTIDYFASNTIGRT